MRGSVHAIVVSSGDLSLTKTRGHGMIIYHIMIIKEQRGELPCMGAL